MRHEFSLFHGLYTLFLMIDVNCDNNVSWKEFSNYLISNNDDNAKNGGSEPPNEVKVDQ